MGEVGVAVVKGLMMIVILILFHIQNLAVLDKPTPLLGVNSRAGIRPPESPALWAFDRRPQSFLEEQAAPAARSAPGQWAERCSISDPRDRGPCGLWRRRVLGPEGAGSACSWTDTQGSTNSRPTYINSKIIIYS